MCVYIYIYIYTYIHTYTYTHTHAQWTLPSISIYEGLTVQLKICFWTTNTDDLFIVVKAYVEPATILG